jgi:hypothetical protein
MVDTHERKGEAMNTFLDTLRRSHVGRRYVMMLVGRELGKPWPAYAWPGGYPIAYITTDCGLLCAACMNDKSNPIKFDTQDTSGWGVISAMALEAPESDERCDHCNDIIATGWTNDEP